MTYFYEKECCIGRKLCQLFTSKERKFVGKNLHGSFFIMQWMWSWPFNYNESVPIFLLTWNVFRTYSYTNWLVVIVLQELHVHSRLGSSSNLSFVCELTLASQLIWYFSSDLTLPKCLIISPKRCRYRANNANQILLA